ncbi:MAG: AEC family transporter [Paracoccaceae bacterium]
MQALIEVILPVFLVIGFGYVAVWRGLFSDSAVDGLMKFAQGFALPCLLFRAIAGLDLGQEFDPRLLASFYAGAALCFAAGIAGARLLFRRDWEDSIAIGFCCLFSNSLLLGLPITERAYGADALTGNYAIVAIHSPFCYALGITAMEVARARGRAGPALVGRVLRAMFRNALIIGILLGFAVNLLSVPVPQAVEGGLDLVIRAALPAALFGLGGVLYRYRPEGDLRTIGFVCAISLLLHPAITWGMGRGLDLGEAGLRSAVVTASMAPGVNSYLFANMYGRARRVAASSVLLATALSVLSVWMWLAILP